jgi:hypothetical protein
MSRIKLAILAAFAVMAVFAVGASGASAAFTLSTATCPVAGAPTALCDEAFAFTGSESFTGSLVAGAETLLRAVFGETEVHIDCTSVTITGIFTMNLLTGNVTLTAVITTFHGCKLLEPLGKKCTVSEELKTNSIKGAITSASEDTFEPETGTTFIELAFGNNGTETCPATIKGTKKVTGSQKCTNVEPEVFAVEKEISCLESGSSLKLGENTAEFKMPVKIHLVNNTERIKVSTA